MFLIITWFLACFSGYNPTLSEEKLNEEAIDTNLLDDPDLDLDGYGVLDGDCDDDNPEINPDAPELCDGIDNNCNDIIDEGISQLWYADADTDGYGDFTQPYFGCEQLEGYVTNDGDCNDAVPEINPEAIEECNGLDDNCDGTADEGIGTPLYADTDFDGFGDPEAMEYSCVPIDGFVSNSDDCDDTSIFINPDAFEICNEQDDNCDGFVDNDPTNAPYWYEDQDGDGFAGYDSVVVSCTQPEGFTLNAEDCDDQNTAVNPDSPEICDGIDNDCNNQIDDNATGSNTFYADNDGDGFGSANNSIEACSRPSGYSTDATDCNDNAGGINPNAQETCDGIDNNCNGLIDGNDSSLDPTSLNTYYMDNDNDGFGSPDQSTQDCSLPNGYTQNDEDCNDNAADINPASSELCDGIDNDCNSQVDDNPIDADTWYSDSDSDGYGASPTAQSCDQPSGFVDNNDDCDDNVSNINPSAAEICDGIDNNCDAQIDIDAINMVEWYADNDADGYGDEFSTLESCTQPNGYTTNKEDCDDNDNAINPNADEICDNIDNNCNSLVDADDPNLDASSQNRYYLDQDGDGFGDPDSILISCSQPNGHSSNSDDCDDTNPNVNPDAREECNGLDNDCNGTIDDNAVNALSWYLDNDNDGYGDPDITVESCSRPSNYVSRNTDCDDDNFNSNPGATEVCDNEDNDCNTQIDDNAVDASTWYADGDSDGFGDPNNTLLSCNQPNGYVNLNTDCDDSDSEVSPIMPEICNEIDDDCNNQIDDNPSNGVTWYADSDQDNFGDPFVTLEACTQPNGYTTNQQDCNDNDASINPAAQELCDEIDNNCDPSDDQTPDLSDLWYADNDGDGFGDPFNNQAACEQPDGYVSNSDDCNDGDVSINPSAAEICNGQDENCNGQIDENSTTTTPWYADADGDGFGDPNSTSNECVAPDGFISDNTDCNDNDGAINPDATEICDNVDNNCNNLIDTDDSGLDVTSQRPYYLDSDADGFGDLNSPLISCSQPNGHSSNSDDCDDTNPDINPDADEVCDGKDNDCSGTVDVNPTDAALWFADADGDGFAGSESIQACEQPDGYLENSTDCDDENAFVNPSAQEICNGIDDDCNDQVDDGATAVDWFADADGDGFGNASDTINTCTPPDGYVLEAGDCNDQNVQVNPGAEEICDGKDNNCDSLIDDDDPTLNDTDGGTFYADTDDDGFGDPSSAISVCFPPNGFVSDNTDCDDSNSSINPGATEVCDGEDNNCDSKVDINAIDASVWYADSDGDGFAGDLDTVLACDQPSDYFPTNPDCDDSNATINPSAPENCNGIDDNCNGQIDDDPVSLGSWYKDVDEDGFGDPDTVEESCEQPDGYVLLDTDCDDSDPDINPDALEICDGVDNDCDEDIDDEDTSLSGSLTEWFRDGDEDGFGDANNRSQSCEVPNGYTEDSSDCDDQNVQVNPDAEEICDGIDNNCDSNIDADATDAVEWFADQDGDGFAGGNTTLSCTQPPNHYLSEEDCDDSNPAINPDALEICDGEDNNCSGQIDDNATNLITFYRDVDDDGYGDLSSPVEACASENGFVENGEDCNDQNANINPDGLEVCDSQDNDCDGLVDDDDPNVDESTQGLFGLDLDGDGYGDANDTIRSCSQPNNYASNVLDCDDTQATINPGETEVCDGIDQDCDGQLDSEASCPCNFYTFEDSSYYFCEQSLRWPWAEFVCQFTNYELVAINSQAENDFVYATAMTISTNQWWTGLNDRALEGDFGWSNGDPLTYENWEAAEPNDSGGEDCMSLNQFGDDLWNDNRCSNSFYFVCETNP